MKKLSLSIAFCIALFAGGDLAAEEAAKPAQAAAQPQAAAQTMDTKISEKTVVNYDALRNRDPFLPLIKPATKDKTAIDKNVPPPRRYPISQFKLKAIIWNRSYGESIAQVQLPDGKSYSLKEGMVVGDTEATVISIKSNEVIIREIVSDPFGNPVPNDVTIRLRKEEE